MRQIPPQGRWRRFFGRMLIGFAVAFVAIIAPCSVWTPEVFARWQVPMVVFFLILYLGVLLFDTLFFDRYR